MNRPGKKKQELTVTVNFLPNRLEEENLAAAYELVLPVTGRTSCTRKRQTGKIEVPVGNQLEIFPILAFRHSAN